MIGDLAAGALDRAILYDRMNRQIVELTTLAKVSEAVTSPLYLDEMLDLVVEMAAKVMGAPICSLHLIDDARGELVVHADRSTTGVLVEAIGGLQQTDRRSRHCREEADHDRESGRRAPDLRRSI